MTQEQYHDIMDMKKKTIIEYAKIIKSQIRNLIYSVENQSTKINFLNRKCYFDSFTGPKSGEHPLST